MRIYENGSQAEELLDQFDGRPGSGGAAQLIEQLKSLRVETPSWAFADSGTRFGIFRQPGAAKAIEQKLEDAAEVHRVTGICPTVAVHVLWDFPDGFDPKLVGFADGLGVRIGAINPTLFQDQCYKYGSLAHPDRTIRRQAVDHVVNSIKLAKQTGSRHISVWLADGTNYPGQDSIADRRNRLIETFGEIHRQLTPEMTLLIEYKPFEPAFYHTDIGDWGMSLLLCRHAGPQARVLVDIGHHYQGQNVEQIVSWLLAEKMLGGFHFNDRRYADDDLTTGSIDPYQVFRIFHEIITARSGAGEPPIAYMVDQSHNVKLKIEAMIQTVDFIHQLFAKALLVDRSSLRNAQMNRQVLDAERFLQDAFLTDTRPLIGYVRRQMGLAPDALQAYRDGGYQHKIESTRK
jgi:L-rhamnose isomerase/sugar isomerase